jgi:hypothetical protein
LRSPRHPQKLPINVPRLLFALLPFVVLLLAGCGTLPPGNAANAQTRQGQVAVRAERTVVADCILIRYGPEDAELLLEKAGSPPLLQLRLRGNRASASGPLAGPGWSGPTFLAPSALDVWIRALRLLSQPETPDALRVQAPRGDTTLEFRFD